MWKIWRELSRALGASLLAGLVAAPPALANNTVIYKWTDRNGHTVYSQTPPAGAARNRAKTLVVASIPAQRQRDAQRDLERLRREADVQQDRLRRQAADDRIEAAIRALETAQADLRAGAAPTPGERIDNFAGEPAVRLGYLDRMSALQARAELARQALDQAYAARSAM